MTRKKKIFCVFLSFVVLLGAYVLGVNFYILGSGKKQIIETEETADLNSVDCVLVLGCGVRPDGTPSDMLRERVQKGVEVFKQSNASYLLLSGDKSSEDYDEPAVMKKLAMELGVKEKDIKIDNIGFSTYESIYNAKKTENVNKIILITQGYHLPRVLYIARKMKIEAYGVRAYLTLYPRQIIWSLREVAARNKDFLKCNFEEVF